MEQLIEYFVGSLNPILSAVLLTVFTIVGFVLISLLKMLFKKLGISTSSSQWDAIEGLITDVVVVLNNKLVDNIKSANNGKLTEQQQEIVYDKAIEYIKAILSSDQVAKICDKYGNLDDGLLVMIEKSINKAKEAKTVNTTITVNTDTNEPELELIEETVNIDTKGFDIIPSPSCTNSNLDSDKILNADDVLNRLNEYIKHNPSASAEDCERAIGGSDIIPLDTINAVIESYKVCNADCKKCGLHCEYCRCSECMNGHVFNTPKIFLNDYINESMRHNIVDIPTGTHHNFPVSNEFKDSSSK